mmetsp:Transcript_11652/g.23361  ORF Transcript_11652/g.23361 Transcript_11652/m.23361 type:complete len:115 (+) Transcript_11652:297-641(+)
MRRPQQIASANISWRSCQTDAIGFQFHNDVLPRVGKILPSGKNCVTDQNKHEPTDPATQQKARECCAFATHAARICYKPDNFPKNWKGKEKKYHRITRVQERAKTPLAATVGKF